MKPIILFREDLDVEGELAVARQYCDVVSYRSLIPPQSLVIGRYSVLPFYSELSKELEYRQSHLINSYQEHCFMANVEAWASEGGPLYGLTPKTWSNWANLPKGSFVLKGRTNSRKNLWKTHMYAPTREDVPKIASRLWDDALISDQGVIVREYLPLKKLGEGFNELPIANEHRTFWLSQEINGERVATLLSSGFYWASHFQDLTEQPILNDKGLQLANYAAQLIADYATFFVLDVAELTSGEWIVIEINDGQMSGLSCCSADELYLNLQKALS